MPVGDIYRLAIEGTIGSDAMVNVLHYKVAASDQTSVEEARLLAQAWETEGMTAYLAMLSNQYQSVRISSRGVTNPIVGWDEVTTGNGAIAGEVSPTQIAVLVNLKTGFIGRSYQGKIYLPAVNEGTVSSGSVVAGQITLIDTWMNLILDVSAAGPEVFNATLGVYSRKLALFNNVTDWQVSQFAATQRRRKPGVGT